MRIMSPRIHGYVDYAFVGLLFLAPTLFGFGGNAAALCYILGAAQMGMSLLTAYPTGVARLIPFTVHGSIEASTTVLLLASPWMFRFSEDIAARNFFIASAVLLAVVWLVTDYRAARSPVSTDRRYGTERHSFV